MITIIQKSEWRFPVENSFVRDTSISVEARLLYIIIKGYAGPDCEMPFPSLGTLSRHMDRHRESVQKYLLELESSGYIKREHSKIKGKFVSTRYALFDRSGKKPLRKLPTTEISSTKNYQLKEEPSGEEPSKGSKETPSVEGARDVQEFDATWKPISGTKAEQLRAIRPPRDYPSERVFDEYIETAELDHIGMGKRSDLYGDLCDRKWQHWNGRRWHAITDWRAYVAGLDAKMEEATGRF